MSYQPRFPTKFTSLDGSTHVFEFPRGGYEWESQQGVASPSSPLTGANYEYDLLEDAIAPKGDGTETLRFEFKGATPAEIDTAFDAALGALRRIGRGWLYTEDAAAVQRRAIARYVVLPSVSWRAGDIFKKVSGIEFRRRSDWFDATEFDSEDIAIDDDEFHVTITNPGNEAVYGAVVTLTGPFDGPTISNVTNNYAMIVQRTAADNTLLVRARCAVPAYEVSNDSGGTWHGDFPNLSLGDGQTQFFVLDPGDNDIEVLNANGGVLRVTFFPPYA